MLPAMTLAEASGDASEIAVKAAIEAVGQLAAGGGAGWQILAIVLTVIGVPLSGLITWLIVGVMKKVGIEANEALQGMVRNQADRVIDQVEAWANKKAQAGEKQDSGSKLSKGVELLGVILKSTGADKKISDKLEHIIEERLMARNIVKTEGSYPGPS